MSRRRIPHRGSSFVSFLEEEGGLESQMNTSRAAVNRILDEQNTSITLTTLTRAASILGYKLKVELKSA